MTNDDKEFLKEFLTGAMLPVGILGVVVLLTIILNGAANWLDSQPTPSNQRFEVVDEYKGCDVVRYNPDGSARYSYFLDCNNTRPVYEK
jgi:hypothetical protein